MLLYALFCQAESNTNSNDTFLLRVLHRCPAAGSKECMNNPLHWSNSVWRPLASSCRFKLEQIIRFLWKFWKCIFRHFKKQSREWRPSWKGLCSLWSEAHGQLHGTANTYILATAVSAFGWERVNFLLSSWYMVVFWIYCKNKVYNSLMSQLLLSSAYPKSRTFSFLMLWQQAGAQEARRKHGQNNWPNLQKRYSIPQNLMLSI